MKTWEISFNSLTATLFRSSFLRKKIFDSKNIEYTYSFYGTDLYVNVYRGVFRTKSNIYGGAPLQKSQKPLL